MIDEIRILGCNYKVEGSNLITIHDKMGCLHLYHRLIQIAEDAHKDKQQDILLHEVGEAICHEMEIHITHDQLCALLSGITQVLRDNPDFTLGFLEIEEEEGDPEHE